MDLFDSPSQPGYKELVKIRVKGIGADVIIFVFDLFRPCMDESYINEIRMNFNSTEKFIYLVGNKCDLYNKMCKNCQENLLKNREKAKMLINLGIIDKYFEVSCKTGEGIHELLNTLKIDSVVSTFINSKINI